MYCELQNQSSAFNPSLQAYELASGTGAAGSTRWVLPGGNFGVSRVLRLKGIVADPALCSPRLTEFDFVCKVFYAKLGIIIMMIPLLQPNMG